MACNSSNFSSCALADCKIVSLLALADRFIASLFAAIASNCFCMSILLLMTSSEDNELSNAHCLKR